MKKKNKSKMGHEAAIAYGSRNRTLLAMGYESYHAYLQSDLWKQIRSSVLSKSRVCISCGGRACVVHHSRYDENTLRGITLIHLHPVCEPCHSKAEFLRDGNKATPDQASKSLGITLSKPQRRFGQKICKFCNNLLPKWDRHGISCIACVRERKKERARARYASARVGPLEKSDLPQ